MGRALVIILAGMVIAIGYTFMGISSQRESMRKRNVNTFYSAKATNLAYTGIQMAIKIKNDTTWTNPQKIDIEDGKLKLTLQVIESDSIIQFTSHASLNGADETVIYTFDVSKKQPILPMFPGALSSVGNGDLNFKEGNSKVHFDGNPPDTTDCPTKPGLIVPDSTDVDNYTNNETISSVDHSEDYENPIEYEEIAKIIESLKPHATIVEDDASFTDEPQVYFIDDRVRLAGQTEGWGILVVRNDAILDIDADLDASGQFEFHGLVIFENETNFSGTGKAIFDGAVIAATNNYSTFDIKANGNFVAQYNCEAKDYADDAVNNALNTTIYQPLSVYEK